MGVAIRGHEGRQGETVFAFCVLKFKTAIDRDAVVDVLRYIAPLVPDPDQLTTEMPAQLEEAIRFLGVPWLPPEAGHAVDAQRRLIETAGPVGVEAAWFFQNGTSLAQEDDEEEEEGDDDGGEGVEEVDEDEVKTAAVAAVSARASTDEKWGADEGWADADEGMVTSTQTIVLGDATGSLSLDETIDRGTGQRARSGSISDTTTLDEADDEPEDDDEDDEPAPSAAAEHEDSEGWSHGPPPQVQSVRFPVDGYPAILDELDWEDFGIAFKLAGPTEPGEGTVLLGFHTLWLAPYSGRYRNAAVTFDRTHHAAHLWVDRFAVSCEAAVQVHHLLWILSKLDEVIGVVHARFAGATMAQKYGGLMGDTSEPFVLGGNPLMAIHASGGEAAVDAWIASATEWSKREIAQMLREVAIEIITSAPRKANGAHEEDEASGEEVDAVFDDNGEDEAIEAADDDEDVEEAGEGDEDEDDDDDDDGGDDDDDDDDDEDEDGDDDDDDEAEGSEDEDRGRQITGFAGELLRARAAAGKLDPRAAAQLMPVLEQSDRYEHRRRAVVEIMGALRYKPAVPAMIRILEDNPITNALDAIGKEELLASTAAALGAIGDPSAIPALSKLVAAPGHHHDKPRPVAADALASCLAAAPEPRDVDDAVLAGLLTTIRERNDGELNAEAHFAYGRIARQLRAERRAEASRKLADSETARDDATATLARHAALVLASGPLGTPGVEVRTLLHDCLTSLDYDHDYTVRNLRVALRVADMLPELVDPADLAWLTRFSEPDLRAHAHALLGKLGHPLAEAPAYDRASARALDDAALVRAIAEPHVVGRAALVGEAERRELVAASQPAIVACDDVISRARQGSANLLDHDSRVLEASVKLLRALPLDAGAVALFDRMLRHSNPHVKWELLQAPPKDERLIGGMFHVLSERWGWQESTAKEWLAEFQGTAAYEVARGRAGSPSLEEEEDDRDIN